MMISPHWRLCDEFVITDHSDELKKMISASDLLEI